MNSIGLLDCTLRDGGYLVDKEFGDNVIRGIIDSLVQSKVDVIEIGFFQNEGFGDGKTVYRNNKDASRYIPVNHGDTEFAVMADYSRFSVQNLDEKRAGNVDIFRACFLKKEWRDAISFMKEVKQKGYKLFVQPVDIMGYSDTELLELIEAVNEIGPYCFSLVDTFGSMYTEDLQRVFELVDHNLVQTSRIGFHSHNNLQMSSALSQAFINMATGRREVMVDATISGMGRGAGNTPTELIAQYMVTKKNASYNIDAILDCIDTYIDAIRARCTWGYSTSYFVAGAYGAHINNIAYLSAKNGIQYKDIRFILNKIGADARKRYHYDLLEQTYLEHLDLNVDDSDGMEELKKNISGKNVLVIVPGKSVLEKESEIKEISSDSVTIKVNFTSDNFPEDYLYFSNARRYKYWKSTAGFEDKHKIVASNIAADGKNELIVNAGKLIKCGPWDNIDNSTVMLLRLLDELAVKKIFIAGFDGYSNEGGALSNYLQKDLEVAVQTENVSKLNTDISEMLADYVRTRKNNCEIKFVTESRFRPFLEVK